MRARWAGALLAWGLAGTPASAVAQEPTAPAVQEQGRPNHAALYLGFTSNDATEFTLGARFDRRAQKERGLGLSGFADVVFADDAEFLLGATLQYHMRGRLMFEAGPGVVFNGGADFFLRTGAGWEFGPAGLVFVPRVNLDFIHGGTTLGYGVSIGRRF